ncbi:Two component regulator propeller [Calidithermus terrae]|uniref:Two component regulator propeller n=1 Tax=Calidithermus terrae TaxID=1408545 RepID=A0A399ETA0_9DEIN|nr:hypothetical protein [Calidithermus terrae]RIH87198.1 Two component regulator propeller [Calidithermus terrae]
MTRRALFFLLVGLLSACGQLATRTPDPAPSPPAALTWGAAPELPAAAAGASLDFRATLSLEGGLGPQAVELSLGGAPGARVLPSRLSLEAGGSYPLNLSLALPKSLAAGEYPLRLTARSGALEATLALSLRVSGSVGEPLPGQPVLEGFTANPAELPLRGGEVTLAWSGRGQGYTLSVSPPQGVSVGHKPYAGPVSLPASATGATLQFAANAGSARAYTLTLQVVGEPGSTPVQASVTVRVQGGRLWLAGRADASPDDEVLLAQGLLHLLDGAVAPAPVLVRPDETFAVAFDAQGNLWVARQSFQGDVVEGYAAAGLGQPDPAPFARITRGVVGPAALAFDPQGNLWVANAWSGNVTAYAAEGLDADPAPVQTLEGGISFPTGLAFDASGNLWVATPFSPSAVNRGMGAVYGFTQASLGEPGPRPAATLTRGIVAPEKIAFDARGDLWVLQEGTQPSRWLTRHPVEGLWQDGEPAVPALDFPERPAALAFDPEGRLWALTPDTLYGFAPEALAQAQPTPAYGYALGGAWHTLAFSR